MVIWISRLWRNLIYPPRLSEIFRIPLGLPAIIEFRGPDALRFLNGQLTQDLRRVRDEKRVLPACITDAKGRLQFRVMLCPAAQGDGFWVVGEEGSAEALEARLTRYLIADDVETGDLTGRYHLTHLTQVPEDVISSGMIWPSSRFGDPGLDVFSPVEDGVAGLEKWPELGGDALEDFRIRKMIPLWGKDLKEGQLPPEARLDLTDISYFKGCYIGQEVISRIKSAGKVNRLLTGFSFGAEEDVREGVELVDAAGAVGGVLTSVSPLAPDGKRHALGYVKRGYAPETLAIP